MPFGDVFVVGRQIGRLRQEPYSLTDRVRPHDWLVQGRPLGATDSQPLQTVGREDVMTRHSAAVAGLCPDRVNKPPKKKMAANHTIQARKARVPGLVEICTRVWR